MNEVTTSDPRDERISLRATGRQRAMIEQAAELSGKSLTAFLLDAAYVEAQRTLADRRYFLLDAAAWERFQAAMDRPVEEKPRLRRLLQTPGVLD